LGGVPLWFYLQLQLAILLQPVLHQVGAACNMSFFVTFVTLKHHCYEGVSLWLYLQLQLAILLQPVLHQVGAGM
jgi:hypothetical protein